MPLSPWSRLSSLLVATAALFAAGCATAPGTPPGSPVPPGQVADSGRSAMLRNSASLLDDLLGDEKNLDKVLVIKGHSEGDFGTLVKAISHAAAAGQTSLAKLAAATPGIDPKALHLPPGEVAARKAIGKTKEKDLLLSAGSNFEFNLLLTQTQALSYGSHLAGVVAENVTDPELATEFKSLEEVLDRLLKQVTTQMRRLPPS